MSAVVTSEATRVDLDVTAGDLLDISIPILDDTGAPAAILDNTGWSVRGHIRRNVHASTVLHEWTSTADTPNAWVITGTAAQVRLAVTPAVTATWQGWSTFVVGWDLDLTEPSTGPGDADGGPTPIRFARGLIRVRPQYTR
jgi:hypothetical protein